MGTNGRSVSVLPIVMPGFILPIAASLLAVALTSPRVFPLTSSKGLESFDVKIKEAKYRGRRAIFLTTNQDTKLGSMAVLKGVDFRNGTIEFDVAGMPIKNAPPTTRGFVGIAFRASDDLTTYENFYLRMTNGRSTSQELRNHAVQYCSLPNFPWNRLRKEAPFRYEAYTDLVVGAWTHVRMSVSGTEAKFYVNYSKQPVLIVHDLIRGDTHGKVALWVTSHSSGYFSNLKVRPARTFQTNG